MQDVLKKSIEDSGKSINAIAVESGVPQPVLHRFVKGERDLTLRTASKLADYLGLALVPIYRGQSRDVRETLDQLEAEGKKNMANISPATVLVLSRQAKKLLGIPLGIARRRRER